MVYIENEGALFRGFSVSFPQEVWRRQTQTWEPYPLEGYKSIEWGNVIDEREARIMMRPE